MRSTYARANSGGLPLAFAAAGGVGGRSIRKSLVEEPDPTLFQGLRRCRTGRGRGLHSPSAAHQNGRFGPLRWADANWVTLFLGAVFLS